ncbi:hypothetical protein S40285_04293 [Stachybotrys chlorohalonatus IBT 40285]|uniref:DNA-(apurinic or apyrimidinic site) endonuclease 2 n=1 Tax=Stachybotrys chlorohalonatus (strain IBT 40285) TaxID=1283841 RepID=A0A084QQ60_STAC4|nr:hypothetical protein S40285_04293 [Stachybotrys chlorohalonata IBT 40285]
MAFRITTWNVNGIRNPFGYQPWREQRTFQAMFDILEADIVVMQETKIQRKDLQDDMVLVPGWDVFFSLPRHKKGYSGVAIYTRNATCAPIRAEEGVTGILTAPKTSVRYRDLPEDQRIGGYPRPGQLASEIDELTLDSEGRCVILEFPAFVLLGVYSPANRDESRNSFRLGFLDALDVRIRNLIAEGKQVILTGDLNVSRSEMDSSNVLESLRKEGMSLEDWMAAPARRLFNQLVFEGQVNGPRDEGRDEPVLWDLCRCFHPDRQGMNTCWDTKRNTRPANNGSRIDYILCSNGLKPWCTSADIQEGLMGSDHCPVFVTFAETVEVNGTKTPLLDLVNPPGMFIGGRRIREWERGDHLAMSAKLIPQFDRRRSIRDMFAKKPGDGSVTQQPPTPQVVSQPDIEQSDVILATQPDDLPTVPPHLLSGTPATQSSHDAGPEPATSALKEKTSATKRPPEPAGASVRSQKRGKTNSTIINGSTKTKVASGQMTLKGFFKPTSTAVTKAASDDFSPKEAETTSTASPSSIARARADTPLGSQTTPTASQSPVKFIDAIESKEGWSKLLGKRMAPRCEHQEPCISLVTKKPGPNCGRAFYICPRPLGPSGEKEKNSEWRCGTFIWSSDWPGSQSA